MTATIAPTSSVTAGIPSTGIPGGGTTAVVAKPPTTNASTATTYNPTPTASNTGAGIGAAVNTVATAAPQVGTTSSGVTTVANVPLTTSASGIAAANNVSNYLDRGAPQSPGIAADIKNAVSALTVFAQGKMDQVQQNIKDLMKSEGGELNAAKLQAYNQELAGFELMMQMAQKLQERQERAAQVWVR